jgi:hypothetical protein
MNSSIYTSNIRALLFRLAEQIQQANSLNLHNDAVHAENFFCELLNLVFGWKLTNANEERQNQATFDLLNTRRRLHVQVTSTKAHKAKYDSVLKSIPNFSKCNTFILIYISKKVKSELLKKRKIKGVSYEGYDLPKLLNHIFYKKKTAVALKPINDILEAELNPVFIGIGHSKGGKQVPNQLIKKLSPKGLINRPLLLSDFFEFTQGANGLLTGGPGYGKSLTVDLLQQQYRKKGLHCFVIRINEMIDGDEKEISE